MTLQASTTARNALLDAIETAIGVSGKLTLYTGTPPANCATAASGSLLATLSLPSDYLANASGGSKVLAGSWTGTASGTGTIGYFRLCASDGVTCHLQGTVGQGTGDLPFDNPAIVSTQTLNVNTFTLAAANS